LQRAKIKDICAAALAKVPAVEFSGHWKNDRGLIES
jgi:hypothetical protein